MNFNGTVDLPPNEKTPGDARGFVLMFTRAGS